MVDCDGASEYGLDRGYMAFRKGGVDLKHVGWGDFVSPPSKYYDPSVAWADHSANHLKPVTVADLGIPNFDEVWVNLGWSTAIDNIVFSDDISLIAPEPGSMTAMASLILLIGTRLKRNHSH